MKSVGTLRKKGLVVDHFVHRKDKPKQRPAISTPQQQPPQQQQQQQQQQTPMSIDLHRFANDNLQPEEFVRKSLGDANEENIRSFYKSLVDAKHVVGGDLQRNVYRNYTEFVSISKEISNLDADVLRIKEYLNELKSIWESFLQMTQDDNQTTQSNRIILPDRKRSDLLGDTHAIHRAQILSLWESVEGAQRFIPQAQHKHIVRECVDMYEINPKTLQSRQTVHLFLLNDCLLVARKRSNHRLVAEYCWSIQDLTIMDMKDTEELKRAFRIVVYPQTFIYQAERLEDKMGLLNAYKRLMDDHHEDKPMDTPVKAISGAPSGQQLHPEKEKYLVELPDQLEVLIALREFEKSVTYIEKARHIVLTSPSSFPIIREAREHVAHYTDILCSIVSRDLSNTLLTKIQFQRYVNWLLRLEQSEKAREVFLATRSMIIKKRIRQLVFGGDITTYISELALVVFTLIRNTCEWYRDSFKQNEMASGFVTWVREQTEIYADIYRRQVFGQKLGCQAIADCFKSTLEHCSILRKVGLDLKFLLEDLFLDNVKETVMNYKQRNMEKVEKFAKNDNFMIVSGQGLGTDVKVTSSVVSFYNLLIKFTNDVCLLSRIQMYSTVIESICSLTEHYLRMMVQESRKNEDNRTIASMNVSFVLDNIVPRVSSQLNHHFNRPIPELDTLRARLRELTYSH
ncbi:exocyst complex component exo84, partial [Rhizopus azygosporus]